MKRGVGGATDDDLLAHAASQQRVLITTDADFDTILALTGADQPQRAAAPRRR